MQDANRSFPLSLRAIIMTMLMALPSPHTTVHCTLVLWDSPAYAIAAVLLGSGKESVKRHALYGSCITSPKYVITTTHGPSFHGLLQTCLAEGHDSD